MLIYSKVRGDPVFQYAQFIFISAAFFLLTLDIKGHQITQGLDAILSNKDSSFWINSPPLSWQDVRGKVLLIEIWTFSCPNCLHVLPHVNGWYEKYKDKGLVIIGVHAPEFPQERDKGNLLKAIASYNIAYPILIDNQYSVWNAFQNQYWPTLYLIDQKSTVVYKQVGEGNYDLLENLIIKLLGL